MKIASWNVNSLRARLPRVLAWLGAQQPDVLCLQETKVVDQGFPIAELSAAGYHALFHGQKTYNGVAILSREPAREIARGFGDGRDDQGARFLYAEVSGIAVGSVYVPNGRIVGSGHFVEKLAWLDRLRRFLQAHASPANPLVLGGDWNVTPDDRDVWDPAALAGQLHCHPDERAALQDLLGFGLTDAFRLHHAEAGRFSWWDYRELGFPRNHGLRLDLLLVTEPLASRCTAADIDRDERKGKGASDHTPVWATFSR